MPEIPPQAPAKERPRSSTTFASELCDSGHDDREDAEQVTRILDVGFPALGVFLQVEGVGISEDSQRARLLK